MFELISQIPFHFTTSLCPLMDPIYYIYHKLYRIFADHVGQSPGRGWWNGTAAFFTCSSSQMHVYCPPPQIKVSCPDLSRGRDKGSQNWCWWPNKFGEVAWHDGSGAIIKNKDNIRARLKIRVGKTHSTTLVTESDFDFGSGALNLEREI